MNQMGRMAVWRRQGASGSWCASWLCVLCCCLVWPLGAAPEFRIEAQFPIGQPARELGADSPPVAVARPGELISGLILIEQEAAGARNAIILDMAMDQAAHDAGLALDEALGGKVLSSSALAIRQTVDIPGKISPFLVQFQIKAPQTPGDYSVNLAVGLFEKSEISEIDESAGAMVRGELKIRVATPEQLAGAVEISRIHFPATAEGAPWTGRAGDVVAQPGVICQGLARIMGRQTGHNAYEPYAWIGVGVKNQWKELVTVMVEAGDVEPSAVSGQPSTSDSEIFSDENQNESVTGVARFNNQPEIRNLKFEISSFFAYDWWQENPRTLSQSSLLTLGPGEERVVALPLFVSPQTPAGRYAAAVRVRPSGGGEPLAAQAYHFRVERDRGGLAAFVIILAAVTGAGVLLLPAFLRRMLPRLYVRQMVLVSLFGALTVAGALLVNVVNSPLQGALGPFNAFVGGFFYRLMMAALWLSLLTLLPYRGVVTLTALLGYLIGGIFFGSFNPLDFILVGSGILYKETALMALGATRSLPPMGERDGAAAGPANLGAGFVWRVALALGMAEAASTFTSLALQMVFYRLYFAEWYVWSVVVLQSFGYMVIGVWLARGPARLVQRLSSPTL